MKKYKYRYYQSAVGLKDYVVLFGRNRYEADLKWKAGYKNKYLLGVEEI